MNQVIKVCTENRKADKFTLRYETMTLIEWRKNDAVHEIIEEWYKRDFYREHSELTKPTEMCLDFTYQLQRIQIEFLIQLIKMIPEEKYRGNKGEDVKALYNLWHTATDKMFIYYCAS